VIDRNAFCVIGCVIVGFGSEIVGVPNHREIGIICLIVGSVFFRRWKKRTEDVS
jgi:hypothetical protein